MCPTERNGKKRGGREEIGLGGEGLGRMKRNRESGGKRRRKKTEGIKENILLSETIPWSKGKRVQHCSVVIFKAWISEEAFRGEEFRLGKVALGVVGWPLGDGDGSLEMRLACDERYGKEEGWRDRKRREADILLQESNGR